jgi:hypothetical protein
MSTLLPVDLIGSLGCLLELGRDLPELADRADRLLVGIKQQDPPSGSVRIRQTNQTDGTRACPACPARVPRVSSGDRTRDAKMP